MTVNSFLALSTIPQSCQAAGPFRNHLTRKLDVSRNLSGMASNAESTEGASQGKCISRDLFSLVNTRLEQTTR
jgi:hypothetical protein